MPERPGNHPPGFPKTARLLAASDFTRVVKKGKRRSGPCFSIHYLPPGDPGPATAARLGITVSRKVSTSAVVRNRIKRILRESFRHHRDTLPAADIVVIARHAAAALERPALRATIDQLWREVRP